MHARRLVGRSSTAIGVLGAVLIGAGAAHAALPRCDGPGSTGDNAAYRGIRFTTAESFGVVAVSLAGSSAGSYSFDAWLRRSSGFTDPIEASRTITISLPTAGSEHPYSTVLIDLASVAVAGPETFTLALESITGPGLLSFETHGIGSQAQCAGVDETEENDVATPTVRADPAGFQLLPVASLACPGPGTGGDLADSRGIRFTASKPFGVIALSFSGTEGNYSFDAELRRSSGFTAPVEATASVTARFPSIGLLPNPSALIDFGNVAVTGPETFTLRVLNVAGPGVLYWETHGIGSQTQCADVDETEENDVAVPTVRADPAGFALFAPEPSAALGCWLAAISLATLARVAPRRRMPR